MTTETQNSFSPLSHFEPCPICERPGTCLTGVPGTEFEGVTACRHVESEQRAGEFGFLHRNDGEEIGPGRIRRFINFLLAENGPGFAHVAYMASTAAWPVQREKLAERTGLTSAALRRLDIGYVTSDFAHKYGLPWAAGACAIPMRTADGLVVGIRLRMGDGTQRALAGSRDGIFLPRDLGDVDQVLIAEGWLDTAALLGMGFAAIGRPSCRGARRELVRWVRRKKPRRVAILVDADPAAVVGAHDLVLNLVEHVEDLRVVTLPVGVRGAFEWKRGGADGAAVQAAVDAAPARKTRLGMRAGGC